MYTLNLYKQKLAFYIRNNIIQDHLYVHIIELLQDQIYRFYKIDWFWMFLLSARI